MILIVGILVFIFKWNKWKIIQILNKLELSASQTPSSVVRILLVVIDLAVVMLKDITVDEVRIIINSTQLIKLPMWLS